MAIFFGDEEEEEDVPELVDNYYFVDGKEEEPVPFSLLPMLFDASEKPLNDDDGAYSEEEKVQVFLHGSADGGLQKVYKRVTAWRVGHEQPDHAELFVLTKQQLGRNKWIKLLKPRKSYEYCVRTILIVVQLLHFLRRKPNSSEKTLWTHLRKVFSSFHVRPSVNDLKDHYPLIRMFVERNEALSKSQLLSTLLTEKPPKKTYSEDLQIDFNAKESFIVDDDVEDDMVDDEGNESDKEMDLFDTVCAICDNGGKLLCCEGRCLRSFHATKKAVTDSGCKSLGLLDAQVEEIQKFLCKNCELKRHQCFSCGKLGSSDKSACPEVFQCANATCGHFYHPKCAADLLFPNNETDAAECRKEIADGESFTCPVHKCFVCTLGENTEDKDLQFAICRRCPKAYHKKCLPRKIAFERVEKEGIIQRAWNDLLPKRILIYCLKHKIDKDLQTPVRNHILFPEKPEKKKVVVLQKSKEKVQSKKKHMTSVDLVQDRVTGKTVHSTEKLSSCEETPPVARTRESAMDEGCDFQKQMKPFMDTAKSDKRKTDGSDLLSNKRSPIENSKASVLGGSQASGDKKFITSHPKIDNATAKKINAILQKASSKWKLEDIIKKRTMPSTHAYTGRNIDKSITLGKVERSVEALRTALQKLDADGTVEDAKAVCKPDTLRRLKKWSRKLELYLSPFLHGMSYTSFGRHFTKVDKLKEIVDKLQFYVQNGDTVVDFCCGANDFSQLMKETLDASGKKCSFKNYDVFQPKNDFNFERRDWMKVQPDELPTGSQLIMGLNPPFGVEAALENKFIDKALTFKPKLIILIVPQETERLDKKHQPYDLIWEDGGSLSGKSFNLPGSVDGNDMQMESWNLKPPILYLWSRPDWTLKHKSIASKHGHVSMDSQERKNQSPVRSTKETLPPVEENFGEIQEKGGSTIPEKTIREDDKNSKKRSPPEGNRSTSLKRRKTKRKQQERTERTLPEKTIREDNKNSKKRSPPEGNGSTSLKRRKTKRKQQEATERTLPEKTIREDDKNSKKRSPPEGNRSSSLQRRKTKRKQQDATERTPPRTRDNSIGDQSRSHPQQETFGKSIEVAETSTEIPSNQDSTLLTSSSTLPSSIAGSSAIQRNAPWLDEMNQSIGPRNSVPSAPPLHGIWNIYDRHGVRKDLPPEVFGFALYPISHQGLGGWLDD